ncbi:hypothetical protein, partial [Pseudomonas sp.]|uniref:hypothetical protein n=1 Tax=Pseudomonas sp. TaxID=306 RepID=UPI003981A716
AIRCGSNFNRQGGSIFHQRQQVRKAIDQDAQSTLVETDVMREFRAVRKGEGSGSDNEWRFLRITLEKGKDLEPAGRLARPSA